MKQPQFVMQMCCRNGSDQSNIRFSLSHSTKKKLTVLRLQDRVDYIYTVNISEYLLMHVMRF